MGPDAYKGFRLAVVGGCQAPGIGRWARFLLPGAQVDAWHVSASQGWAPDVVAPQITDHDLVICQLPDGSGGGALEVTRLREVRENVVFLPLLVFTGFHPDMLTVRAEGEPPRFAIGPFSGYQSALVASAFCLGIPIERVPRLFNALVFDALGYFQAFVQAREALVRLGAEHGYDLAGACEEWLHEGVFMYSDNHPMIRVLGTLARQALVKAGLELAGLEFAGLEFAGLGEAPPPPDDLAVSHQLPCYPALARRIGVAGSLMFMRSSYGLPPGHSREMTLEEFVAMSYDVFAAARPRLEGRVEWTAEALRSLLGPRGVAARRGEPGLPM